MLKNYIKGSMLMELSLYGAMFSYLVLIAS